MNVTLNENCRRLEGYPATISSVHGYFLIVDVEGIAEPLRLTPGHVVEEEAVVETFGIKEAA